jgi:hypothetical protein
LSAATGTEMLKRPEPVGSMLTALPATSAVVPPGVTMLPLLATCGAASTTWPPGALVMLPSLRTVPLVVVPPDRRKAPALNWSMSAVSEVATRLPTLTCEPGANNTPLGFCR